MIVFKEIADIKEFIRNIKKSDESVGFVPTMGYLHEGHMSLVNESVKKNDVTVVSIFVNPTQFGPNEDLEAYPRDFERDKEMLAKAGANAIFFPEPETMYGKGACTTVSLSGLTETLCGKSRPVHFAGVATVVTKLFNIVKPDNAYFGSKDYQQLQVIKRMVNDLNMDVNVVGMPIVRENDGLAMSSRNIYIEKEQRDSALSLSRSFGIVQEALKDGERSASVIRKLIIDFIEKHKYTTVDYVEIVHPEELQPLSDIDGDFVVALAVKVGKARLIDNKYFEIK
jgi:pantoate--beta-alanine ligase